MLRSIKIPAAEAYWLKVCMADDGTYTFGFSFDGEEFLDMEHIIKARKGTWTGAKLGIAALNDKNIPGTGYVDFAYLHVE